MPASHNIIIHGDNLPVLRSMPDACVDLIYVDPPFNSGRIQRREQTRFVADPNGTRQGFKGKSYSVEAVNSLEWDDRFEDFQEFLRPRLEEARRVLRETGTLY